MKINVSFTIFSPVPPILFIYKVNIKSRTDKCKKYEMFKVEALTSSLFLLSSMK